MSDAWTADRRGIRRQKETTLRRLGGFPEFLPVPIGPPLDPGARGPLGPVWPSGFRIVAAGNASTAEMLAADFVAFLSPSNLPEDFLQGALAVIREVSETRSDGRMGPGVCVYLQKHLIEARPDVLERASRAGAYLLGDADLHVTAPPKTSEELARAINVMSRQMHDGPDLGTKDVPE